MSRDLTTLIKTLESFSERPSPGSAEYHRWIEQADFIEFLSSVGNIEDVIIYASAVHLFLYCVLVPTELVSPLDKEDLANWGCNPFSSWGVCVTFSGDRDAYISPPLASAGSGTIEQGEQLIFARDFDGRHEDRSYIECSQRLAHLFDLHYVPERSAYCRFDARGDIEDVLRIVTFSDNSGDSGRAVIMPKAVLDEYMALTNQSLMFLFDSTRFTPSSFGEWPEDATEYHDLSDDVFYRVCRAPGSASYIRGAAVIRSRMNISDVIDRHGYGTPEVRQYASFIAEDWKHKRVCECSSDPALLGNYFVRSDLPFGTTPAFFRADVLLKYKADPDKYLIRDRSITCRHAWYLKSFDINEVGQIHTYLIDLSRLPYDEQLYWKSFNEHPKGPISKRAYQTDFRGEWDLSYDPLPELKQQLHELHEKHVRWWVLRNEELMQRVHYPMSTAADEWARELHSLDKLLIEGFEVKVLREIAEAHDVIVDAKWGSIKLIAEIVTVLDCDEVVRAEIVDPLRELHRLRSKVSGHASGSEARKIKVSILKEHKSYPKHFRELCAKCDCAISTLAKLLPSAAGIQGKQ